MFVSASEKLVKMGKTEDILAKRRVILVLLLILLAGTVLRFYGLDNNSLGNDELASWRRSNYDTFNEVIHEQIYNENHPPGHQVLLFFVEKYLGDSEWILRFPSAIAGILSIFFIFLLGSRLYTYREGLISAVVMAFAWCPIYYSQEARAYSFLLLFTLMSTYYWDLIVRNLNNRKFKSIYSILIGYIVTASLTCYFHYFGVLVIGLQGLGAAILFIRRGKILRYIILVYSLIALTYAPWWFPFWLHLTKGPPTWIQQPNLDAFRSFLKFSFNGRSEVLYCLLPFYLYFFGFSVYRLHSDKDWKEKFNLGNPTFMVCLWLFVPFIIAYVKSTFSTPVLINRVLIISLPAVYLLLSRSITRLPIPRKFINFIVLGIITLLLLNNLFVKDYYTKPQKQQFREAVQYIVEKDIDNVAQTSIIAGYAWHKDYFNYYLDKYNSIKRVDIIAGKTDDIPRFSETIQKYNPEYFWYITGHRVPDKQFLDYLNNEYRLVISKEYRGAQARLFQNINR
jgi:4-amino-4-deoxy-L-arabinose transferase-like glycosyltransferase